MNEGLIDLTNYSEHPSEPSWLVFRYPTSEQAREMVRLCDAHRIINEADLVDGPPFMVGVRKRHASAAEQLNYLALGKYRKPFIPSTFWRWALVVFFGVLMLVALIGMWKAV